MRFSLRTLLLFFPALIIAYGLSWGIAEGVLERPRLPKPAEWSGYDYNAWLSEYMEKSNRNADDPPIDWQKLNSYFAGQLPTTDLDYHLFSLAYPRTADYRDQPYACVPLNDSYEPDVTIDPPQRLGFYSVGPDGVSLSLGNDPDDTNSWLFEQTGYMRSWRAEKAWYYRRVALCLMPFMLFVVYWVWKKFTHQKSRRRALPMTIDYPEGEKPVPEFLRS